MVLYRKVLVYQYQKALLYIDGRLDRILEPGSYRLIRPFRRIDVVPVDMRVQSLSIVGQEIMTSDSVTLRVNIVARYRVRDPDQAVNQVVGYGDQLYTDLQLAAREAFGAQALDALLMSKASLGRSLASAARDKAAMYGLELQDVGVKDIVLPGDMKAILNQVIEARKRAEADQIARREEVAATRSLANTAALMEKNPTLLRLKEMELMEKVLANGGNKLIVGLPPRLLGLADQV